MTHTRSAFVRRNQGALLHEANMGADMPTQVPIVHEQTNKQAHTVTRMQIRMSAAHLKAMLAA